MYLWDEADDKLREECGVFGISGHEEAAAVTALGLHALQHRGQDAAGMVTCQGDTLNQRKGNGLVQDVFRQQHMNHLIGTMGIGHNRYPTCLLYTSPSPRD